MYFFFVKLLLFNLNVKVYLLYEILCLNSQTFINIEIEFCIKKVEYKKHSLFVIVDKKEKKTKFKVSDNFDRFMAFVFFLYYYLHYTYIET